MGALQCGGGQQSWRAHVVSATKCRHRESAASILCKFALLEDARLFGLGLMPTRRERGAVTGLF